MSGEWTVYVDGSSNKTTCGAGIILEGSDDLILEQTPNLEFKDTNNQVENEVILVGLSLAYDMGAREVMCKSDSQLVVGQIKGDFEVRKPLLQWYYHTVSNLVAQFKRVTMEHIRREDNMRVDALYQLATTK